MIDFEQDNRAQELPVVSIKVVGVGGAGGNTINSIVESSNNFIECIAVNTDAQALGVSKANIKIQLGVKSTKGMGTGANPELGKRAAEEDLSKVINVLEGSDIVFLTGGMGGGTGSGALPVIARAVRELGILSVAVVTKPFQFEGKRRAIVAEKAIELLEKEVDTLLIVPNQKLLEITEKNISMINAFAMINNILGQSVKGISQIITSPGHINVDFADVKTIMKNTGIAVMGSGTASGQNRAFEAAMQAISSPLLENMSIEGATGVLLNITGSSNLGLHEIGEAASIIHEQASPNANIILGSVIDETEGDNVTVTIIATGFKKERQFDSQEFNAQQFNNKQLNSQQFYSQEFSPKEFCSQEFNYQQINSKQINSQELNNKKVENNELEFLSKEKAIEQKNFEQNNFEQKKSPEIKQENEIFEKDLSKIYENVSMSTHDSNTTSKIEKSDGKKESSSDFSDFNNLNDLDVPSFMRKSV